MSQKIDKSHHWADEKEITSSRPLAVMLFFIKLLPIPLSMAITHFIAVLFFFFSKRAKAECLRYQNQMHEYFPHFKKNIFMQILVFSLSLVDKVESWIGRLNLNAITFCDDDIGDLKARLENKQGAILICSHLGNSDMLRSLADWGRTAVSHYIPMVSVMDMKSTANFNRMMTMANSHFRMHTVDPDNITPATVEVLEDCILQGGLVVIAGDRTANHNRDRVFTQNFLGKLAPFAFGAFYMPLLLKVPVYFIFAMRDKDYGLFSHYTMHVNKSKLPLCQTKKQRMKGAKDLCKEFCTTLENYVLQKPYQWYNFYDFWQLPSEIVK